jgi:hypothetical protein
VYYKRIPSPLKGKDFGIGQNPSPLKGKDWSGSGKRQILVGCAKDFGQSGSGKRQMCAIG